MFTACQKDHTNPEVKFKEKIFIPTDEMSAKASVLDFLATTTHSESASIRSEFPNKEINEGLWILEGSANYLKNVNITNRDQSHIKTYSLTISNVITNGVLEMNGIEMTNSFNDLIREINEEETLVNVKAMFVDFNFSNVSESESNIDVKVVYGEESVLSVNSHDWSWAAYYINHTCDLYLLNRHYDREGLCSDWFPDVLIYSAERGEQTGPDCNEGETICLSESIYAPHTTDHLFSYEYQWLGDLPQEGEGLDEGEGDIGAALYMGQERIDIVNNSGGAIRNPQLKLKRVTVHHYYHSISNGNNGFLRKHYLFIGTIIGSAYTYCY